MPDKLEQCLDDNSSSTKSTDISTCNQEEPEALKDQKAKQCEARKVGATPSSLDLPKIKMDDCEKWQSALTPAAAEKIQTSTDSQVCSPETEKRAKTGSDTDPSKPISTETDEKGRVVHEKYATGPDVVVAYDENGEAHRFKNEPIKEMPPKFDQVPEWRQKQLDDKAKEILDKYHTPEAPGEVPYMDFEKVSDMQKDIASRQDMTETEKCLVYSKIQTTMREGGITVENWNEKPEMIDSWSGQSDPWHAIAAIDDRYHNRLVNLTPEEATKAIHEQEDRTEGDMHPTLVGRTLWKIARRVYGINEGDVNASEGQLKCMRELREKGTFSAYADEWEKQFVKKGGNNPHDQGGAEGAPPYGRQRPHFVPKEAKE